VEGRFKRQKGRLREKRNQPRLLFIPLKERKMEKISTEATFRLPFPPKFNITGLFTPETEKGEENRVFIFRKQQQPRIIRRRGSGLQ